MNLSIFDLNYFLKELRKYLNPFIKLIIFGGLGYALYKQVFTNADVKDALHALEDNLIHGRGWFILVLILTGLNWAIETIKWKFLVNKLDKTIFTIAEGYVKPANRLKRAIVIKNPLTAQYTLNAQWELMIDSALTDAGLNSDDSVIIGGLVVKMMQGMGANSKFKMYYDVNADAILGKYSFMIIPRGALQLVTWNDFVGSRRFISSDNLMEQSVKLVPLADGGSLNIDYFWKYDPACGEFAYMPQIYAELIKAVDGNCVSANQDGLFIFSNCTDDLIETCA